MRDNFEVKSDNFEWQGRIDSPRKERFHQVVKPIDLATASPFPSGKKTFALLGFQSDEGIRRNKGRPGACEAPNAIRAELANLPLPDRGELRIVDAGNISCGDGDLELAQKALGQAVEQLLAKGALPLLLGGGHEIAWGHYQGIEGFAPQADIGVVNIDAHFDLRPLLEGGKGSSGTSFSQIADSRKAKGLPFSYYCLGIQKSGNTAALQEKATTVGATTIYAEDFYLGDQELILQKVSEVIAMHEKIYLSLCMDVFAAPYAPGVSAPQPLGLTPWQVVPLLRAFARSQKVIGFDIAEVSPPLDHEGRTSRLAASLLREFICA